METVTGSSLRLRGFIKRQLVCSGVIIRWRWKDREWELASDDWRRNNWNRRYRIMLSRRGRGREYTKGTSRC